MDPTAPQILYVAGLGRSGSTVLGNVLGSAPGFFHIGEFCLVWRFLADGLPLQCGCGAPLPECAVWSAVFAESHGGVDRVDARRLAAIRERVIKSRYLLWSTATHLDPARNSDTRFYLDQLLRVYGAIGRVTGATTVVDTSKLPSLAHVLTHAASVDASVIHLVRDARAVTYSWLSGRYFTRPERPLGRLRDFSRWALYNNAVWTVWNLALERERRRCPDRYLRLHYELFTRSPRAAVEAIAGLLEHPIEVPFIDGNTIATGINHTLGGNWNRFRDGTTRLREDTEWRTGLSPPARLAAALLSAPARRALEAH